ncbi:DUF3570 domain-containing protein [Oceanicoccus sagamiensis]|uniref:DUF3570 domain-containing protein n=1 Tax=Oceanicoccus sagamiensis TaxID=716816 RepID=UPI0030845441
MIKQLSCLSLLTLSLNLSAAVLPEDRADVMYHSYDGGGVTIDGPSLLVRKDFASTVSVSGNYYVDNVSSASIDVETSGASKYTEERTEYSVTADYLYDKAILSAGYTSSDENDYEAETVYFGISQDFFGDLTTVTLGYAVGDDTVMQNGNDNLQEDVDRQNYRFGISQIATPNLMLNFNYEAITEEGYLNNPYRSYRYIDPSNSANYLSATEVYPDTRTTDAAAFGGKYFLPYRAVVSANYRYFTDDWDIDAHTLTLGYTHPLKGGWILDFTYRYYQQESAYFYSDLHEFAAVDEKDFRARDKELSEFTTQTLGFGVSYEFQLGNSDTFDKSSINLQYDFIQFDYDNFRDIRGDEAIGEEPLYDFDADVIRLFFSVWY